MIDTIEPYDPEPDYHAVVTIQLCELVEDGFCDRQLTGQVSTHTPQPTQAKNSSFQVPVVPSLDTLRHWDGHLREQVPQKMQRSMSLTSSPRVFSKGSRTKNG